jgi:hypothetical protein
MVFSAQGTGALSQYKTCVQIELATLGAFEHTIDMQVVVGLPRTLRVHLARNRRRHPVIALGVGAHGGAFALGVWRTRGCILKHGILRAFSLWDWRRLDGVACFLGCVGRGCFLLEIPHHGNILWK